MYCLKTRVPRVAGSPQSTTWYKWIWPRVIADPGWLRETPLFTFLAASLASWSSPDRPERPGPAQGPPGANAPPSAAAHAVYAARAGRTWPKYGHFDLKKRTDVGTDFLWTSPSGL